MESTRKLFTVMMLGLLVLLVASVWWTDAWVGPVYDFGVGFFTFPSDPLLAPRRPGALWLVACLGRIGITLATMLAVLGRWLSDGARALAYALLVAFAARALLWVAAGDLPLVQADSAHHWCLADNVSQGRGSTLDYVASFFRVYPRWGMVDDWSQPLYAYYLGYIFWCFGNSVTTAHAATFVINLATIPLLYHLARHEYGARVALASAWTVALFPPHCLQASMLLKESLMCFCTVLAVFTFLLSWRARWWLAIALPLGAGLASGLMVLTRSTGLAVVAAMVLYALFTPTWGRWWRLLLFFMTFLLVLTPWVWLTYRDYGIPFYSYTNHFKYMPSWPDHWIQRGVPTWRDYVKHGWGSILHTKMVITWMIGSFFWFVFTPLLALGYCAWVREGWRQPLGRLSLLMALGFVGGTITQIAGPDQVRDFSRYFPPVLLPMFPVALASIFHLLETNTKVGRQREVGERVFWILLVSAFWGGYPWSSCYRLLADPWHIHLSKLRPVASALREQLPADAIVMAYHPWEVHMYSDRRTVLLPRNLSPRRMREEVNTYGVTHILVESSFRLALPAMAAEFGLDMDYSQLATQGMAVYRIKR